MKHKCSLLDPCEACYRKAYGETSTGKPLRVRKLWYHTGFDSYDNPEINRYAKDEQPERYGSKGFATFDAAQKDLLKQVDEQAAIMRDMRQRVLGLYKRR